MATKDPKLERLLASARDYASRGMVNFTLMRLNEARDHAITTELEISEVMLVNIEQNAYRSGVNTVLEQARDAASREMTDLVITQLGVAREYAAKVDLDITYRIKEIEALIHK